MKYGFGIDVGGTSVKLALFDLEGNIVEKWSIPTRTEDGGKHVLPDIAASVLECLEKKEISRQDLSGRMFPFILLNIPLTQKYAMLTWNMRNRLILAIMSGLVGM